MVAGSFQKDPLAVELEAVAVVNSIGAETERLVVDADDLACAAERCPGQIEVRRGQVPAPGTGTVTETKTFPAAAAATVSSTGGELATCSPAMPLAIATIPVSTESVAASCPWFSTVTETRATPCSS